MSKYRNVSKLLADDMGVTSEYTWQGYRYSYKGKRLYFYPEIEDANFRELVREFYGLTTRLMQTGEWMCTYSYKVEHGVQVKNLTGKTITESEIACCLEIAKRVFQKTGKQH